MQIIRLLIHAPFFAIAGLCMNGGNSAYANGIEDHLSRPPPPPPCTKKRALKANAGGPYKAVERGGSVRLDGSRSTGCRLKFEWFFGPEQECKSGPGNADATKKGKRVAVTLLCSIEAILKVTNRRSGESDSASVKVKVKPRPWKVRVIHHSNWNVKPNWRALSGITGANSLDCKEVAGYQLGENYCALPHPGKHLVSRGTSAIGALHPHGNIFHNTWLDHGYKVAQIRDENGPFDGWHYIAEHELKLTREGVFNAHIGPGTEFHRVNKAKGFNVERFYKGLERHEGWGSGRRRSGHSRIFKDFLGTSDDNGNSNDPAKRIELLYARSKDDLRKKANGTINDLNVRIAAASEDPLELINWDSGRFGKYWVYDPYAEKWCHAPDDRM